MLNGKVAVDVLGPAVAAAGAAPGPARAQAAGQLSPQLVAALGDVQAW